MENIKLEYVVYDKNWTGYGFIAMEYIYIEEIESYESYFRLEVIGEYMSVSIAESDGYYVMEDVTYLFDTVELLAELEKQLGNNIQEFDHTQFYKDYCKQMEERF